jgi:FKBP-type peptidyl-prolyl cis-trans isomerase
MSKTFVGILVACIIFLAGAVYFIFGFNQTGNKPNATTDTATKPTQELKIEDLKKGTGPQVKSGDTIRIHYKGTLTDGTPFDSSYDRGEPFETKIGVGDVIKGWDQGVIGMQVGGKRKLIIPPSLGYGDQPAGTIPPNSTLVFEVELIEIK